MANEQNQPLDANSRLKARLRPSVPPRDTSLLRRLNEDEEAIAPVVDLPGPVSRPASEPEVTNEPVQAQPKNGLLNKPQKLVSFTLRVDEAIDHGLKLLCSNERITKETFLEAAYLACQKDDQMLEQILEIAKARRQERKEAGVIRRAKAMTKYLE
jgi:hypothetical protein